MSVGLQTFANKVSRAVRGGKALDASVVKDAQALGVDLVGKPVLRMADDEDGEEVWITAESLARELFVGMSILDWTHRMLLRWLYDQRPAPKDSLAILTPASDLSEPEFWDNGGGLPGTRRIASVTEDPAQLAALLEASSPAEAS